MKPILLALAALAFACSSAQTRTSTWTPPHGAITRLSEAPAGTPRCEHEVPETVCTRCNPELEPKFKAVHDWCAEHARPESQCLICHPDLDFDPLPEIGEGADLAHASQGGEDVPDLDALAVPGKVTVLDFWATWCAPCRKVDAFLYGKLAERQDLAVRKLNVVSWDSPLAKHHLQGVPSLPWLVVYGPDGKRRGAVSGLDLARLGELIGGAP